MDYRLQARLQASQIMANVCSSWKSKSSNKTMLSNQCHMCSLTLSVRMRKTSNNIVAPVIAVGVLLPCCPAAHVVILSQINFAAILARIPS